MIKKIKEIKWLILYLPKLYKKYKGNTDANLFFILKNFAYFKLFHNKHIIAHRKVIIKGIENLVLKGSLEIGVNKFGVLLDNDFTLLNLKGKLIINSTHYSIGRGCRISIDKNAKVQIGEGGHITAFSKFIISNKLIVGDNCAISWGCQFLDDDHQNISYLGKQEKKSEIIIGDNIWIGSGVQIYKGTNIADGCVISANSIVRGVFNEPNSLIAGNPAKVIKSDVKWN